MYQIHTYLTGNTLDMEQCERLTQYKSIITFVPNLSHNFKFTNTHSDGSSFSFTKENKLLQTINPLGYVPLFSLSPQFLM